MKKPRYTIAEDRLHLVDEELDLDRTAPFCPTPTEEGERHHGQVRLYDADGKVQGESYYWEGQLQGPSRFYDGSGQLVCESWFIEGKREGRRTTPTSVERFVGGVPHGKQEFFYEGGQLRTQLEYREGTLHNLASLYYPNGQLRRQIGFKGGKREGLERMWSEKGVLLLEATYAKDQLVGRSRRWHLDGKLAEEIVYHGPPQRHDKRVWRENGNPLLEGVWEGERYTEKWWSVEGELVNLRVGRWEGRLIYE